ncbi:MAG: HprK-related kinase A [Kiloniellaceae bacterium]
MLIRDLAPDQLERALRGPGITLETGPFATRLRLESPSLARSFAAAYAPYPITTSPSLYDFTVELRRARGRFGLPARRGAMQAHIAGAAAFDPFPAAYAYPMLESAFNWCIATDLLRYITFHAAAVERGGRALVLTGPSGSGKSTLAAALSRSGWRLLSDELVLLRLGTPEIVANPRPISLKNQAIEVIAALAPDARFSPRYEGTIRGTISFLLPTPETVAQAARGARPSMVVAPAFQDGASCALESLDKAAGFARLTENSVNYFSTLKPGFETLARLTDDCRFHALTYGDLREAVDLLTRLHDAGAAGDAAA